MLSYHSVGILLLLLTFSICSSHPLFANEVIHDGRYVHRLDNDSKSVTEELQTKYGHFHPGYRIESFLANPDETILVLLKPKAGGPRNFWIMAKIDTRVGIETPEGTTILDEQVSSAALFHQMVGKHLVVARRVEGDDHSLLIVRYAFNAENGKWELDPTFGDEKPGLVIFHNMNVFAKTVTTEKGITSIRGVSSNGKKVEIQFTADSGRRVEP